MANCKIDPVMMSMNLCQLCEDPLDDVIRAYFENESISSSKKWSKGQEKCEEIFA